MAKKRKTKEQKKLADLRHTFGHSSSVNQPVFTIKTESLAKNLTLNTIKTESPHSKEKYPFLVKDLSKTGLLTGAILGFQFVLYFLITRHMFKIPGLIY